MSLRNLLHSLLMLGTGALLAIGGDASVAQMPSEVAAQLQAIGRTVNPPATATIYTPRQLDREPYTNVTVQRDIAYGPDPRNLLDVFAPVGAPTAPQRILMFVHGGAFTMGNKRGPHNSPFYDNVMLWAVKNGMTGVNMTYRLGPQDGWPAAQIDIGQAVRWVHTHLLSPGATPPQIFLMDHSAGAAHVAAYVGHEPSHLVPGSGLSGALILSGIFSLSPELADGPAQVYFGRDPATYAEQRWATR